MKRSVLRRLFIGRRRGSAACHSVCRLRTVACLPELSLYRSLSLSWSWAAVVVTRFERKRAAEQQQLSCVCLLSN